MMETGKPPKLMREWILDELKKGEVKGLEYINQEKTMFKVAWKHGSRQGWAEDKDACLFKRWAIHTGKFQKGLEKTNPKRWKANFRCAINSLSDIKEVKEQTIKKGMDAFRMYEILPEKITRRGRCKARQEQKVNRPRRRPGRPRKSSAAEDTLTMPKMEADPEKRSESTSPQSSMDTSDTAESSPCPDDAASVHDASLEDFVYERDDVNSIDITYDDDTQNIDNTTMNQLFPGVNHSSERLPEFSSLLQYHNGSDKISLAGHSPGDQSPDSGLASSGDEAESDFMEHSYANSTTYAPTTVLQDTNDSRCVYDRPSLLSGCGGKVVVEETPPVEGLTALSDFPPLSQYNSNCFTSGPYQTISPYSGTHVDATQEEKCEEKDVLEMIIQMQCEQGKTYTDISRSSLSFPDQDVLATTLSTLDALCRNKPVAKVAINISTGDRSSMTSQ